MNAVTGRGSLQVLLEGKGLVTLRPTDHIATGGQGSIYKISDFVVKVFLDPAKMVKDRLPDKIQRLALLKHPYVIAPRGLARLPSGDPVGYYMPFIEDPPAAYPLARVFTNDFYRQEGFTDRLASMLVARMRETVMFAHERGALLVDPNELNWFAVSVRKDPEPRIVDVDSWAIDKWLPTAIMPSIRDWHAKKFDANTDWFAWGVVSFQVYTGIHPYKGTLDGYARGDMEKRMKDNASVFTPNVRLNRAVRDFSCIPGPLLNWYEATFQKGERTEPPSPFDTGVTTPRAARVLRMVTTGKSGLLAFEKILGFEGDPIVRVFHCGAALLASGKIFDLGGKRYIANVNSPHCEIVKVSNGWLIGEVASRFVTFTYVAEGNRKTEILQFKSQAHRLLSYENRMFVITDQGLMEVASTIFGDKLIASPGQVWGVMVRSTKWFSGIGVLDALGAKFLIVPFGTGSVAQIRVRELDGLQVVAGKAGNRFASFIAIEKNGDYRKIEITFDREYRTYAIWTGITDGPELNLAILPKGVCATIVRDGELDIFVPTNHNVTKVEDKQIATDMLLTNWEDKVMYIVDGAVWTVRMH